MIFETRDGEWGSLIASKACWGWGAEGWKVGDVMLDLRISIG